MTDPCLNGGILLYNRKLEFHYCGCFQGYVGPLCNVKEDVFCKSSINAAKNNLLETIAVLQNQNNALEASLHTLQMHSMFFYIVTLVLLALLLFVLIFFNCIKCCRSSKTTSLSP
uniref:EGF-like domain-containing protein n=1 Tax=Steinernema glaseri TaxID=37863 RepID=A0A1I7YKU4_9BILA